MLPRRESEALLAQARAEIEPIAACDPHAISVHPSTTSREVVLRYRGLAFARWDDGRIVFGCNDMRKELTPVSRAAFERMMQNLGIYRHPLASDTRHPLYRAQAERWLESPVRNDITRVDSVLDSRFVYAQVFAGGGAEYGIIDVLTITRAGRLAILELKASEHIHLPVQAADYWLRLRRNLELDEFRTYGWLFSWRRNSRCPTAGLSGCCGAAFASSDGHFAGCAFAANRSGSRWLDGKLAQGHSRGHARIANHKSPLAIYSC